MSLGIRPPGELNEAYVNMRMVTSPEALKSVKIFADFNASMLYGVLLWTIFIVLYCKLKFSYDVPISLYIYQKWM